MIDGVVKRTYGLPSRPAPRQDSPAVTPAEELESWLPDEVCAACGSQVAARQLYCSAKCKEVDEAKQTSSASQRSSSPSHDDDLAMSPRGTSTRASPATFKADGSANLRYAYPQSSPLLLAQRQARSTAPGFDKALLAHRADAALTSSDAGDQQHVDAELRRRSSSASSSNSSTASSSALLTDPSTPSPALGSAKHRSAKARNGVADDYQDDDEDLNASDFQLPPSMTPAIKSAVMMNRAEADQHQAPSSLWERERDPHPRSQNRITSDPQHQQRTMPSMSFARRPSSTHLPAPVLYSPALSAKSSRPSPLLRSDKARASGTTASTKSKATPATSNNALKSFKTHTKIPSLGAALEPAGRRHSGSGDEIAMPSRGQSVDQGVPASQPVGHDPSSMALASANFGVGSRPAAPSAPAAVVVMNRSSSDPVPSRSSNVASPQKHEQEDSSSEDTKTLAASRSSQLASLRSPPSSELCGRPGCAGAFSNRSQQDPSASPRLSGSTSPRRPSLSSSVSASINRTPTASGSRRRDDRRHRHTHSAQAGLSIHDHFSMRPQLLMTPARATKPLDSPSASPSGMVSPAAPAAATGHAGGRGRSKMRDSRSVSRRSRSPPRAAARGRSQALASEERARKQPHPDSPPIEAVKPRSQPIAITRRPSGQAAAAAASSASSSAAASSPHTSASLAADESDVGSQGGGRRGRRGRSPAQAQDRQRRISSVVIKAASRPLVDMSHRQDVQHKDTSDESFDSCDVGGAKADPGFDDVEDLELEA